MKIFLVGGFLGSGKTTAIKNAAQYFMKTGRHIAVITNDQGLEQVDTRFIQSHRIPVEEVAGGCFCCKFDDLKTHIDGFEKSLNPEIIFAESVGSCTDLGATVINPLLQLKEQGHEINFSVFADIRLLGYFLQGKKDIFHGNVNYIYEKQLEEADLIIVNKIDLLNDEQLQLAKTLIEKEYGHKKILYQNSLLEKDIIDWVALLMQETGRNETIQTLDIDYDRYAEGEAALAWLDEEISIEGEDAFGVAIQIIQDFYQAMTEKKFSIGHLKFLIRYGEDEIKISATTLSAPDIPKHIEKPKTRNVDLLVNARVQVEPKILEDIFSELITKMRSAKIIELKKTAFSPSYPKPLYRIQT